ncbi:MAG TPA: glycogen debranching enzyme N-terminal domain-containing protein [Candidatus Eisenbacteria bacterium]
MRLGQELLTDPRLGLAKEWRLANGLGGSACGTAIGAHTRRAHGLLHASGFHGCVTTQLLKLDERLHTGTGSLDLAVNVHAGGVMRPTGYTFLEEFRLDPWPTWRFGAAGVRLEKSLFLIPGHHAVVVVYRHLEGPASRLTVSPLVVSRGPREIQHEHPEMVDSVQGQPGRVRIEFGGRRPALTLWHNGTFLPARVWQRGLEYAEEAEPGAEDALVPGYIEAALQPGAALHVVAATEETLFRTLASEGRLGTPPPKTLADCIAAIEQAELERHVAAGRARLEAADITARQAAAAHGNPEAAAEGRLSLLDGRDPWTAPLAEAMELALVRRGHRLTLVAGYPEAEERGVETMRSLPGLISLRAFDAARAVLRGYAEHLDDGLAPSGFDLEDGTPRYGDPGPALWMVHAADLLIRRSEDHEFLKDGIYPKLESVMHYYRSGTRAGVRVDDDGLLVTGEGATASKSAELNALWYHALVAMAQLARVVGRRESVAFYLAWARQHHKCFNDSFWDEARGRLYERVSIRELVAGLTPSQLLAASLSPSLLPPDRALRLVKSVERELFTSCGLKAGNGAGPLSPEWLGAFFTAYLRVHGRSPESQARVRGWLEELRASLAGGPAESLRLQGAPLRLVTVAELLRVWIEEVDHVGDALAVS